MGMLDGKVALITGAGSGMAKASTKVFVREGASVLATDISGAENDTAKEVGEGVLPLHCDVTKEDDVAAAVDAAVAEFGKLDVVLNVAGIGIGSPIDSFDLSAYDQVFDVNVRGVLHGMKHGSRAMLAAGNGGAIVNWSSIGGIGGTPYTSVYNASKHGVVGITKSRVRGARPERHPGQLHLSRVHPHRDHGRGRRRQPAGHVHEGVARPRR